MFAENGSEAVPTQHKGIERERAVYMQASASIYLNSGQYRPTGNFVRFSLTSRDVWVLLTFPSDGRNFSKLSICPSENLSFLALSNTQF